MTKDEIKEKLTELGIEFDEKMKKDELANLLQAELEVAELEQKPKKYIVVHDFKDLEDNGAIYFKGDKYPRKSVQVDDERIQELLSTNNKIGKQLIKEQE